MTPQRSNASSAAATWLADGGALFGIGLGEDVAVRSVEAAMQIGPYQLIDKLGEGGLGVVWRARQTAPIQREVAIKLTKPGMHYRAEVITRFELERQALARMQHPNIAAILDAGTLPDERPYFVMELVHGVPLTAYCTTHRLSVRARLQLFITICHAVHHAHQKGILHRDLKPSNILVGEQDGQPVPKVIDFGIAKALDDTDPALNDPFFKTQLGDLPCATYQYMSPEQASRGLVDIDTRSDIYTLGVILYELLTGKLPLPDDLARGGSFEAIASYLRDAEPERPSQRVTTMGTKTSDLRGDLDWIVLRALERNRERRYESAASLAEDLQRHLAHEPVNAGPPSALYRCGKWVRRHRVAFGSITAITASLCAGLVSTSMALQREAEQRANADKSRALAEQREHEALAAQNSEAMARERAEVARHVADEARARAEQLINDMLFDLRDKLEPVGRLPLLEQVALSAQQYFNAVPASEDNDFQQRNRAAMLQNRGSILLAKGDAKGAKELFDQSLEFAKRRAQQQPANVQCLHDLALAHERVGSAHEALHDDDAAASSYVEMNRVFVHLKSSAPSGVGSWQQDQAVGLERLGDLARKHGQTAKAVEHYRSGAAVLASLQPNEVVHRRLAVLEGKLGAMEPEQAQKHFERALELWAGLITGKADDVSLIQGAAIAHGQLAMVVQGEAAVSHAEAQVNSFAQLHLIDPLRFDWQRGYGTSLFQHGVVLEKTGKASEAIEPYIMAAKQFGRLPDANRDLAAVHVRLAALHFRQNAPEQARHYAEQALEFLKGSNDAEAKSWRETLAELMK